MAMTGARRCFLGIGIDEYKTGSLKNAVKSACGVSEAFRQLGYLTRSELWFAWLCRKKEILSLKTDQCCVIKDYSLNPFLGLPRPKSEVSQQRRIEHPNSTGVDSKFRGAQGSCRLHHRCDSLLLRRARCGGQGPRFVKRGANFLGFCRLFLARVLEL